MLERQISLRNPLGLLRVLPNRRGGGEATAVQNGGGRRRLPGILALAELEEHGAVRLGGDEDAVAVPHALLLEEATELAQQQSASRPDRRQAQGPEVGGLILHYKLPQRRAIHPCFGGVSARMGGRLPLLRLILG
jgi:hypothetical protein